MRTSPRYRARLTAGLLVSVRVAVYGASSMPEPNMTYLDNGEVRIGMDLALGGAVTLISSKEHPGNIINSADLGRQIQTSHYAFRERVADL